MALEKKFDKNALEMAAALWFTLHTIKTTRTECGEI